MNPNIKVYEAERVLYSGPFATRFTDVVEAQAFLDRVLASKAFSSRFPGTAKRDIRIRPSQRYEWAGASPDDNKIRVPIWAMNDITLLHELAHFCQGREKEDHGKVFCGAYLFLVKRYISPDLARRLRLCYQAYDVEFRLV